MNLSLSEIKVFQEVVRTQNISRAAERLGLTQPAVSLAIKKIEGELGVMLLIRTKKGVSLTKAGERLIGHTKQLIHIWENVKEKVTQEAQAIQGTYSIGVHPTLGTHSLPKTIASLLSEQSGLSFRFLHNISDKISEAVISFRLDFGIVVHPPKHPDLVILPLFNDQVMLWTCSRPTRLQNPKHPECVIIHSPPMLQAQQILKVAAQKKLLDHCRFVESTSLSFIAGLVASGAGMGILPKSLALGAYPNILKPLPESPIYRDKISLIYRKELQQTVASRYIKDYLRKALNPS